MWSNTSSNDSLDIPECSGTHLGPPPAILRHLVKKSFLKIFHFFALILAHFWLKSGIQLRVKNSKTLFFSKWSLISKIRHGYGLRLYLNLLRRLWRPRKRQIDPDFFLQTGPWKWCFSEAALTSQAKKLIFEWKIRFLKSVLKTCNVIKYEF